MIAKFSPSRFEHQSLTILVSLLILGVLHPLFWLLATAWIVLAFKQIEQRLQHRFAEYSWWHAAIPIGLFFVVLSISAPFPEGDLLRDMVAHRVDFDYSKLYPDAPLLPKHNLYLGFDRLVGFFDSSFGPIIGARVVALAVKITISLSVLLGLYSILRENKQKWLWIPLIFAVLNLTAFGERTLSGRPELLATAWLFSAAFLPSLLWLAIGILGAPLYWLWPIYAVGGVLLKGKHAINALIAIAALAYGVGFWYFSTDGAWADSLSLVNQWASNRLFTVYELKPITSVLISVPMIILTMLTVTALAIKWDRALLTKIMPPCFVLAFFLLPNYMRYITPVAAALALLCAHTVENIDLSRVRPALRGVGFLAICAMVLMCSDKYQAKPEPRFHIKDGSYVLTQADQAEYMTTLLNSTSRFAPALEVGASSQDVQLLAGLSAKGIIDCPGLIKHGFTHVQESSLKAIPSCLKLEQIDGKWRLWEVRQQATAKP